MSDLSPLARRVIEAYGGEDRWRSASAIECRISAHGWAFRLKLRRPVKGVSFRLDVGRPHVVMQPWDKRGNRAVFDGDADEVRIESPEGETLSGRKNPRRGFPYGRRLFHWDDLDTAYFSGYASWNYITLPRLLLRDDIAWNQVSDATLEARFPPAVPTHSPVQRFHFDAETSLLRQHDYTAEVFGGWAKAANVVLAHTISDGLPYASSRRVTPRAGSVKPRPFPLLVGIEISDYRMR